MQGRIPCRRIQGGGAPWQVQEGAEAPSGAKWLAILRNLPDNTEPIWKLRRSAMRCQWVCDLPGHESEDGGITGAYQLYRICRIIPEALSQQTIRWSVCWLEAADSRPNQEKSGSEGSGVALPADCWSGWKYSREPVPGPRLIHRVSLGDISGSHHADLPELRWFRQGSLYTAWI